MLASHEAEVLATNLRVLAALHRVLDLLSELPVVVFKGPLLTMRLYGGLHARASADNDLWLPESSVREALRRLLAAGFTAGPHVEPFAALTWRGQVALWPEGDVDQVSLDLHARPFARPFFSVDDSVLSEHLELDLSTGRPITTFDRRLAFCHAVAHYVQHHLADSQLEVTRRLWLENVAWSDSSAEPSFDLNEGDGELLRLVDRTCGRAAAELALDRCRSLDGRPRRGILRAPRARAVALGLAWFGGAPPGVVRKFLALYLTAPERLTSGAWAAAFPPSAVLHEQYGLGPRPWLLLKHLARVLGER